MKARLIIILLLIFSARLQAQLRIDGREAAYDSIRCTWLASVSQVYFDEDVELLVDASWKSLWIDGSKVGGSHFFRNISAATEYALQYTDETGEQRESKLQFTFLPILRLEGSFGYDYQGGTFILSDPDEDASVVLAPNIKWRGGTTNAPDKHKRNYKVKFDGDYSFFGLRKDNNWILDAGQADVFRLRNRTATEVWNDFATKPYYHRSEPKALSGTRGRVVELFLNNEYEGVYCLTENLDRKQMKLKKFDSQTGEIHGTLWKSDGYGSAMMLTQPPPYDNHSETWDVFEAKYPDLNDLDSTDFSTLYHAIDFVVNSSDDEFASQVDAYFDLPVVLDYYLFINVLGALDNRGKNMIWAVYDKAVDKRLTLAVWDLDCTVGQRWADKYNPDHSSPTYEVGTGINLIERLKKLNVEQFNEKTIERYTELRHTVFSYDSLAGRYRSYCDLLNQSGAAEREQNRWSGDTDVDGESIDFEAETEYICQWIEQHLSHLDAIVFPLVEGVQETMVAPRPNASHYYSLSGQDLGRHPAKKPGIYIRNGRKVIVK